MPLPFSSGHHSLLSEELLGDFSGRTGSPRETLTHVSGRASYSCSTGRYTSRCRRDLIGDPAQRAEAAPLGCPVPGAVRVGLRAADAAALPGHTTVCRTLPKRLELFGQFDRIRRPRGGPRCRPAAGRHANYERCLLYRTVTSL